MPHPRYNSIRQYYYGLTYRREKIKSINYLLRSFKKTFKNEPLQNLLTERKLLLDYSLEESITSYELNSKNQQVIFNELNRRENIFKQSIQLLENFKIFLENPKNESEIQEKSRLSKEYQLKEVESAKACLCTLLKIICH